jgi:hypothetical protein
MDLQETLQKIKNAKNAFVATEEELLKTIAFESKKGFYEAVCAVVPDDYQLLQLARHVEMDSNGNAAKHLDHYLKGSGLDLKVDLARVFKEAINVRTIVYQNIKDNFKFNKHQGSVPIAQPVYFHKDWRLAIGGMNVNWEKNGQDKIRCYFRNKYQWHPEDRRTTQCIHEAAVRLQKKIYARDYWMYGEMEIYIREL